MGAEPPVTDRATYARFPTITVPLNPNRPHHVPDSFRELLSCLFYVVTPIRPAVDSIGQSVSAANALDLNLHHLRRINRHPL